MSKKNFRVGNFVNICCGIFVLILSGCSERAVRKAPPKSRKNPWHAGSERPYVIKGVKYYPQLHYRYNAVGFASWYGRESLGPTATGRPFNPYKLTAAHRTLPLPCVAEVENLKNHKKIQVLVNDRGPFAHTDKRIIDLSFWAAKKLGFHHRGLCKVRVKCLPKRSKIAAIQFGRIPY